MQSESLDMQTEHVFEPVAHTHEDYDSVSLIQLADTADLEDDIQISEEAFAAFKRLHTGVGEAPHVEVHPESHGVRSSPLRMRYFQLGGQSQQLSVPAVNKYQQGRSTHQQAGVYVESFINKRRILGLKTYPYGYTFDV